MLAAAVARQLSRQDGATGAGTQKRAEAHRQLARDLEAVTAGHERQGEVAWSLIKVAELLAREGRAKGHVPNGPWRPGGVDGAASIPRGRDADTAHNEVLP